MLALCNNIFQLAKVDMTYSNNNLIQPPTFGQKMIEYPPERNIYEIILRINTTVCWLGCQTINGQHPINTNQFRHTYLTMI
jgi:hypothetical protein